MIENKVEAYRKNFLDRLAEMGEEAERLFPMHRPGVPEAIAAMADAYQKLYQYSVE